MQNEYREVLFDKYCGTCKHKDSKESDYTCDECLHNPVNLYSEKPVNWEEKETKRKTRQ